MIATVAISSHGEVGRHQIAETAVHGLVLDTVTGRVLSGYGMTFPRFTAIRWLIVISCGAIQRLRKLGSADPAIVSADLAKP